MKKNNHFRIFSVAIFSLFAFIFLSLNAFAQETGSSAKEIQVSPIRFELDFLAGEKKSGTINIKNYSPDDYQVNMQVEDFYVSNDSSQANFFIPDSGHPLIAYDVINWIKPAENEFVIKGGEAKNLAFDIEVPEGTPTGGYYGALFVQHKKLNSEGKLDGSGVSINTRVGVLMILAVKGSQPIIRNGEMKSFMPEKKIFWDKPAKIVAQINNSGNLQYKMNGKMDIYRFGKLVKTIDFEPKMVYPNKLRPYDGEWNFNFWNYGFYKTKAEFSSEDGEIKVAGETSFTVIPWKTTVVIILILILIWAAFHFGKKRGRKKLQNMQNMQNAQNIRYDHNFNSDRMNRRM